MEVRPLERKDYKAATGVLARTFYEDPGFVWLIPDISYTKARMDKMEWLMGKLVQGYALKNVPTSIYCQDMTNGTPTDKKNNNHNNSNDVVKAVLLCSPPLRSSTLIDYLKLGFALAPFKLGFNTTIKMLRIFLRQDNLRETIMDDCVDGYWYIGFIGVDPDMQGKGLGGKLLENFLSQVDNTDRPAYLETAKESLVGWYERYGFRVIVKEPLPGQGPPLWYMRREAQSVRDAAGEEVDVEELRLRVDLMTERVEKNWWLVLSVVVLLMAALLAYLVKMVFAI
jgi:GNAT superfamily N-acetyltransferase